MEWLKKARNTIAVAQRRSPDELGGAKVLQDVTFVAWVVYHNRTQGVSVLPSPATRAI